ncbi:endonuclease domain-containing protein [Roseateles sp. So40a]|uniref:endonuclease domain-containing protein n=1 Tax=Roseateles sp. So40a TaxID=3400226 RepID=UPI003A859AD8
MDDNESPHPGRKNAARALRSEGTRAERALWHHLRDRRFAGHKFRRQHPIGTYFADFACIEAGLVIELDGGQHGGPRDAAYDARRSAAMLTSGFHVLRFTNREAMQELEGVLARIHHWLVTRE